MNQILENFLSCRLEVFLKVNSFYDGQNRYYDVRKVASVLLGISIRGKFQVF